MSGQHAVPSPGRRRAFLAVAALLAGCANVLPLGEEVPNPPLVPERGVVFLFNGATLSSEGTLGTGTHALAQDIRRRGVRAEVDRPGGWEAAAERVIADPAMRGAPIAVYGYSLGARSGLSLAERLGEAGIPVQTVLALEAYGPGPVPCTVREALHLYLSDSVLSQATRIAPARAGCTRVTNALVREAVPGATGLDHVSVSYFADLRAEALRVLLDGDRVRIRPGS